MLKRWSIENFKSFAGRTDIALAPITIFAGANSSGKSTIIQSMLLLKQTVQYAPINRPMALNGPLLKLGQFDDVVNSNSKERHVGVAWEMDVEDLTQQWQRSQTDFFSAMPYYYFGFGRMDVRVVAGEFKWDATPIEEAGPAVNRATSELLQLYPRLVSCAVKTTPKSPDGKESEIFLSRADAPPSKRGFNFQVDSIDEASREEVYG